MPKYSREMEDKIIALFEQGKRNSVISRELSIYRGALPSRRKEWEKRNLEQEKPETEPEKTIQQEQNDSHPLNPQIYTLIRYQGTHSREEALSQAIETQHSFNPYLLNHGLETPKELIKFFEDKIQFELENVQDLKSDLKLEMNISRGWIFDQQETIAKLEETITEVKESAEQRYEEGLEQGREDHAIYVRCAHCGEIYQVEPQSETHGAVTQALLELGWGHSSCVRKVEYSRRVGSRALEAALRRY